MEGHHQCGIIGCHNDATKRCKQCGIRYCSRECQRKAWPNHKHFCAPTFIERMIKFVRTCDYPITAINNLSDVYINYKFRYESLFSKTMTGSPDSCFNKRCIFCHKDLINQAYYKYWDEKDFGDIILWSYTTCDNCCDKNLCQNCLLPHDSSKRCPMMERFELLLKGQPWITKLPAEMINMIEKRVKSDFIDHLLT